MVRKVATLGRSHTKEYVTEFVIQYSDDGEMWRSYVNPDGEVQVMCKPLLSFFLAVLIFRQRICLI